MQHPLTLDEQVATSEYWRGPTSQPLRWHRWQAGAKKKVLPLTSKLSLSTKTAWSVATARVFPSSAICLAPPSLPTCPLTPNKAARSTARACSKPNGACFELDDAVAPPVVPLGASNRARATAQRLTSIKHRQ